MQGLGGAVSRLGGTLARMPLCLKRTFSARRFGDKIGALVTVSTRRVYVRLASAFPLQSLFAQAHRALAGLVAEDG